MPFFYRFFTVVRPFLHRFFILEHRYGSDSMNSWAEWFWWIFSVASLIAVDIYFFYIARKSLKLIERYETLPTEEVFKRVNEEMDDLQELKNEAAVLLEVYKDPGVVVGILRETIDDTLAVYGAESLKEIAASREWSPEKAKQVDMARIHGLRRMGHEIAEGAGIKQMFAEIQAKIPSFGGAGGAEGGGDDLFSRLFNNLLGNIIPGGGGGGVSDAQLQGAKQVSGVTQELKK